MIKFLTKIFLGCFSLLIILSLSSCSSKPKNELLQGPFVKETGYCWVANLPQHENSADTMQDGSRSKLILYEDGKTLGPAHSMHDDIRSKGGGRYSHWAGSGLYFSTSDNSDPNKNGKKYTFSL